jgi:hypothetical protein
MLTPYDRTGATRVFIFDHTIRRAPIDNRDGTSGAITRGPGFRVHIDQTYKAAENRVTYHLPNEADELLKKRFQIINVRPPFPFLPPIPSFPHSPIISLTGFGRSGDPSRQFTATLSVSPPRTQSPNLTSYPSNSSTPIVRARHLL